MIDLHKTEDDKEIMSNVTEDSHPFQRNRRNKRSLAALASISIVLASCGTSTLAANRSATTTTANLQSQKAYKACLVAHGFSFPKFNAKNPPTTVASSVRAKAVAACAGIGGGPQSDGFTISKTRQKAIRAYVACLQTHGVTVSSSAATARRGGVPGLRALSQQPGAASALKACANLKPAFGRAQTFSSSNSSTTTTG